MLSFLYEGLIKMRSLKIHLTSFSRILNCSWQATLIAMIYSFLKSVVKPVFEPSILSNVKAWLPCYAGLLWQAPMSQQTWRTCCSSAGSTGLCVAETRMEALPSFHRNKRIETLLKAFFIHFYRKWRVPLWPVSLPTPTTLKFRERNWVGIHMQKDSTIFVFVLQ